MKPAPPVTRTRDISSVTGSLDDRTGASPQNRGIQGEGPVVDVLQVEPCPLRKVVDGLAPVHLPQAGQARLCAELAHLPYLEITIFGGKDRTWSDEAHVANQHAPQLGQLVDAVLPEPAPERRDPRVLRDLEHRTLPFVQVEQVGLQRIGIPHHRPEFESDKWSAVFSEYPPAIENRTFRAHLDCERCRKQEG